MPRLVRISDDRKQHIAVLFGPRSLACRAHPNACFRRDVPIGASYLRLVAQSQSNDQQYVRLFFWRDTVLFYVRPYQSRCSRVRDRLSN